MPLQVVERLPPCRSLPWIQTFTEVGDAVLHFTCFSHLNIILDIYGDDEFAVKLEDSIEPTEFTEGDSPQVPDAAESPSLSIKEEDNATPEKPAPAAPPSQDVHSSLPPKPVPQNASSSSGSLSYSAQIAQQFSAYQQTPSQERQQRSEQPKQIPSALDGGDSIFGKKPSEMHDAG